MFDLSARIDWLIEGLNHKDEVIRGSAGAELEVVRGKPFGFSPGMSKKERVAIQRSFREWWSFRLCLTYRLEQITCLAARDLVEHVVPA